ncbi:hypothetical protein ADN00_10125 [Ornatilinea apprima]|uniref:Uncharacterized protein n=1 Tax=Ornatilinea apprima TaxID=1134406 RepID=A0A0P6XU95_9CHLR|nr:hypothetical protein [Ornatilinea apprima]KPL76939.1 hypothetical protein ADN00_10125 [Ornatilinea apprima]
MTTLPINECFEPPDELDGAKVLLWAYNPEKPFFMMLFEDGSNYKPIHGFAICRYGGEELFYKFSCNSEWEVENDSDHASIEEAIHAAHHLSKEPIVWNQKLPATE